MSSIQPLITILSKFFFFCSSKREALSVRRDSLSPYQQQKNYLASQTVFSPISLLQTSFRSNACLQVGISICSEKIKFSWLIITLSSVIMKYALILSC